MHWARGEEPQPILLNIQPCREEGGASACSIGDELRDVEVLLSGGESAQAGTCAGCAVYVSEGYNLESFPHGVITAARASGIVTELEASISHPATVARGSFGYPAVFGAKGCLIGLQTGSR